MAAAFPITGCGSASATRVPRRATDVKALRLSKISVTPLKLDLTDYSLSECLARALWHDGGLAWMQAGASSEGFAAFVLRLRGEGIADNGLLTAVEADAAPLFVPPHSRRSLWSSRTIPIDCGEAMEGADLQARMLACAADRAGGQRVLEIGTGTGFTARVMARLAERVLTVDRYKTLHQAQRSASRRSASAISSHRQADGTGGYAGRGAFRPHRLPRRPSRPCRASLSTSCRPAA